MSIMFENWEPRLSIDFHKTYKKW